MNLEVFIDYKHNDCNQHGITWDGLASL